MLQVTGKAADCVWAAHQAMEVALRMLRPGEHKNMEVTDAVSRAVESYGCKPIENMLSHQLLKDKIGARIFFIFIFFKFWRIYFNLWINSI